MKTALAALAALALTNAAVAGPMQGAGSEKARTLANADAISTLVVDKLWVTADKYWHDGDYNRIIGLGRICIEADPNFDEAVDACSWLLWSLGDIPSADWLLNYGVQRSPKKGIFYNNLGQHLFRTKRYDKALTYLEKAVALGGVPPTAYATLGHTYTRLNRPADAVKAWKQCVEKFPDFPAGAKNLKQAEERLAATDK